MSASHRGKRSSLEIQRSVLFALFVREVKTRFGGTWAGMIWVLLEPLANVLILMAIFGAMHRSFSPSIPYPVFLVTGMLPFFLFRNLTFRLMEAIDANRGLFAYRQVKPMDTLVSRALLEIVVLSAVYALALGVLTWLGYSVLPARPLELVGVSVLLILLGMSLGLLLAVATHDAPRLRTFVRISTTPLYMLSGVVFPVRALPQEVLWWLSWNPALHVVELSRNCFFPNYPLLREVDVGYVCEFALVCLALGMSLYRVRRQQLIAMV
jgi:capsular polysaccharide transport system permease protein